MERNTLIIIVVLFIITNCFNFELFYNNKKNIKNVEKMTSNNTRFSNLNDKITSLETLLNNKVTSLENTVKSIFPNAETIVFGDTKIIGKYNSVRFMHRVSENPLEVWGKQFMDERRW